MSGARLESRAGTVEAVNSELFFVHLQQAAIGVEKKHYGTALYHCLRAQEKVTAETTPIHRQVLRNLHTYVASAHATQYRQSRH